MLNHLLANRYQLSWQIYITFSISLKQFLVFLSFGEYRWSCQTLKPLWLHPQVLHHRAAVDSESMRCNWLIASVKYFPKQRQ